MSPRGGEVDSMSTQAVPKYGMGAVREVHYVSTGTGTETGRGAKRQSPYVQVKQRKNGQYVVVERLPVHHKPRNHGLPTLQQSLAESEVKLNSIKPGWMPTPNVKDVSKQEFLNGGKKHKETRGGGGGSPRDRSSSIPDLPPIDLGYREKAQALVGSLDNVRYEPGGGRTRIHTKKLHWESKAKVGSLDNVDYRPTPKRRSNTSQSDPVVSRRLPYFIEPSPRYGALASSGALGQNMHYKNPGGGRGVEVFRSPARFKDVRPRVGSLENIAYVPGGGQVALVNRSTAWKAEAKVGSLDNVSHKPSGGNVFITHKSLQWQAKPRVGSLDNVHYRPSASPVQIPRNKTEWKGRSRVGSLQNIHHQPGGGHVSIVNNRLRWEAQPKVDTKPPVRFGHTSSLDSLDSSY